MSENTVSIENYPNKQPNSAYCFVCGRDNPRGLYMSFYDNGKDEVLSEYTVDEIYQGYPGIVHGGIVTSMLDEVVARVSMIADPHHFMMSVTLQVKFRHSVPTETPLRILGKIVRLRGRLGKAVGQIILPNGTVAAESEMTLANVPQELMSSVNLEALGWRVDT
ncbi:MAG: PaaI family thioesterase [Chloroflexota bacterium]